MSVSLRLGASLIALFSGLLVTAPAYAAEPDPPPELASTTLTVTETTYNADGELIDVVAHATIEGTTAAATAGSSSGTSSASGCKLVSVLKEGKTALGFTAYQFVNQTHWCWTRSSQRVYDVWTDWFLGKFDSNYHWRGIVKYVHGFYDYATNDGHPRSAFKNLRIGRVDNCVLKYGCLAAIYPKVLIRSYYNGTYVWEIGG